MGKKSNLRDISDDLTRIGNRAVHKAQEENRQLGIPNVYSKNGRIYYQLPDGTITEERPEVYKRNGEKQE